MLYSCCDIGDVVSLCLCLFPFFSFVYCCLDDILSLLGLSDYGSLIYSVLLWQFYIYLDFQYSFLYYSILLSKFCFLSRIVPSSLPSSNHQTLNSFVNAIFSSALFILWLFIFVICCFFMMILSILSLQYSHETYDNLYLFFLLNIQDISYNDLNSEGASLLEQLLCTKSRLISLKASGMLHLNIVFW